MNQTRLVFIPIFMLLCHMALAQKNHEKIIQQFKTAENDSIFIRNHSKIPYELLTASRGTIPYTFNNLDSLLFYHHHLGDVVGPFDADDLLGYVKIVAVDSSIRMKVRTIFLSPNNREPDSTALLATAILDSIKKNGNFNEMCTRYSEDDNQKYGCELPWFFQTVMVNEFEEAVIDKKKDDVLLVKSRYGSHIVQVMENPLLDRCKIDYVVLYLRKK